MPVASQSVRKPSRVYLRRGHSLTQGLVACYPFFAGAGTVLRDVSGRQNHGTINGADWTNGPMGPSLQFVKTNTDNVDIPDGMITGSQNRTFICRVKPTDLSAVGSGMDYYVMSLGSNADAERWSIGFGGVTNNDFRIEIQGSGETVVANFPTDVWSLMCAVLKGTTFGDHTLYWWRPADDDLQSAGVTGTATVNTTSGNAVIGQKLDNDSSRHYDGFLDVAALYNRALTETEIRQWFYDPLAPFITKPR